MHIMCPAYQFIRLFHQPNAMTCTLYNGGISTHEHVLMAVPLRQIMCFSIQDDDAESRQVTFSFIILYQQFICFDININSK